MAIGSDIVARAMKHEGVTDFFYIMGAPMMGVEKACMTLGLRGIDVRHEQAAAMAGFAYSRLLNRPSFCMAASGPGVTNLLTGIAHAWADCTPVIALGGAAPVVTWHRGAFQDIDQLAFRHVTWQQTFWFFEKPQHQLHSIITRVVLDSWRTVARPMGLGFREDIARLPSYSAGILSVGAIALLLWRLGFPTAGVLAAFLLVIHPWHIRYASEMRAYSFMMFVVPLGYVFLTDALHTGYWRWRRRFWRRALHLDGPATPCISTLLSEPASVGPLTAIAIPMAKSRSAHPDRGDSLL